MKQFCDIVFLRKEFHLILRFINFMVNFIVVVMPEEVHEIEVAKKDPSVERLRRGLEDLGIKGTGLQHATRYILKGDLTQGDCERIAQELFATPVTDRFVIGEDTLLSEQYGAIRREIALKPGVMNPAAMNIERALRNMGYGDVSVQTTDVWAFWDYQEGDIDTALFSYLGNSTIQRVRQKGDDLFPETVPITPSRQEIEILGLDADALMRISREGRLALNALEMETIQEEYDRLGRNPTREELETYAQTWSEHCVHKTVRGAIELDYDGEVIHFKNLLGETIVEPTRQLNKHWTLSVFVDNAGVIAFDETHGLAFKVETHNHPTAIEPYGGAATGIGGVIRDILGTGKSANPLLSTDAYFVGPSDMKLEDVPQGVFHPRVILTREADGVKDYGNRMGIPKPVGGIFEDASYIGNPLLYAGCVGIIPRKDIEKELQVGYRVVLVGGRTGRDGIHGVTFASRELTGASQKLSSGAVQIGNAIEEKRMTDAILLARDEGLIDTIQDCGGGGLSSAVGELGEKVGVKVYLDRVPLKYPGLTPAEIWISEAQERMVIGVSPDKVENLLAHMREWDVEATDIGEFTGDGRLQLYHGDLQVADMNMNFVHHGCPKVEKKAQWRRPDLEEPEIKEKGKYGEELRDMFRRGNLANKRAFIEQHDRSVQGTRVRDSLAGPHQDGPQDGVVYVPFPGSTRGYAVSMGINPWFGEIDPREMARNAVDEALRNLVAAGCNLEEVALLDNVSMGNPDDPEVLGALCLIYMGCRDAALGYQTPFISGKDSLNNEFEGRRIMHTLVVSSLGIVPDVRRTITMDLKAPDNYIYLVGETRPELGGSEYYRMLGYTGNSIPRVDNIPQRREMMNRLAREIYDGNVVSCHDCSEGGVVAAAAEMAMAGVKGVDISLQGILSQGVETVYQAAFSESATRFLAEVPEGREHDFEKGMEGYPVMRIGYVSPEPAFVVRGRGASAIINEDIAQLRTLARSRYAWRA